LLGRFVHCDRRHPQHFYAENKVSLIAFEEKFL